MKKPELLLPAGSLDRLKTAFLYGADAVYCGTPSMSLRAKSKFTMEEVKEGVELANTLGKKIYLTLNLFTHNSDLERLPEFVKTLNEIKPHGVIVADPAVFMYLRENAPELNLHVSTQSNVCSWMSVKFWEKLGAKMCVLAREVNLADLKIIRENCPNIKLEAFIHGSMCMSYSGRCLLSNFMADRGANQGNCAHSCRWLYKLHLKLKDGTLKELELNEDNIELFDMLLEEEFRPGDFLELVETERGANILNSKDLCLLPRLKDFIEAEVDCMKVEGRNKTQYYVGMVAKTYRRAIDDYFNNPQDWNIDNYLDDLYSISNRGYSLAFADGHLTNLANNYDNTKSISEWEFAGYVEESNDDSLLIMAKNKLVAGDEIEFISPSLEKPITLKLNNFVDGESGAVLAEINAGQQKPFRLPLSELASSGYSREELKRHLPKYTLLRKAKALNDAEKARIEQDKATFKLEITSNSKAEFESKRQEFMSNRHQ